MTFTLVRAELWLAHVGARTVDGRRIDHLRVSADARLASVVDYQDRPVGVVVEIVYLPDGWVVGRGWITPETVGKACEIELLDVSLYTERDPEGVVTVGMTGELGKIVVGDQPAWPDATVRPVR